MTVGLRVIKSVCNWVLGMFIQKNKSFRVVLDGEVGGHAMMLVMGCQDMDECIRHTMKTKDKGMKISRVEEITRFGH